MIPKNHHEVMRRALHQVLRNCEQIIHLPGVKEAYAEAEATLAWLDAQETK